MPHRKAIQSKAREASLVAYKPVAGIPDELVDPDGNVRPVWRGFLDYLSALDPGDIAMRFALADQHLADSGVYFRHADGDESWERPWPLSHVPVLISEQEWAGIEIGLAQRADLLELVLKDVYGRNNLVQTGRLPPMLLAQNPEWMRPMVGVTPRSEHFLHFVSFELGRSPTGQWWVLNDRTQAPSGAGFALENRVATSRMYSDFFQSTNICRLAGFFRTFKDHLYSMRGPDSTHPAILSPGSHTDTYFEHAYTARYLGLLLLQGEDIVVERGRPMVRTISGLKPVDVLWRRIDSGFADPLELDERSQIGIPGLVGALRQQGATMINSIGSGVVETRALMAFMPSICEALTGESLRLPNIATWWCGQEAERKYVWDNLDEMMISSALSTRLPFDPEDTTAIGGKLRSSAFSTVQELFDNRAKYLVGQQAVTLSTSPAYVDGKLQPRPMTLRVFLSRSENGWVAMPGGYARIGRSDDVTALSMHAGGTCADVWIMSDKPVAIETMISVSEDPQFADNESELPSRTAENLYWLGRYVERAEFSTRLTRAFDIRVAESSATDPPLIDHLAGYLRFLGIDPEQSVPTAIAEALQSAARCARRLRDQLSPDGLVAVSNVEAIVNNSGSDAGRAAHMGKILRQTIAFSGLVQENMYRSTGWQFLSAGRAVERAMSTCSLVASLVDPSAPPGAMEAALDCADSKRTHQRRFGFGMSCETVTALLCLDRRNPRSVLYQLDELKSHLEMLPGSTESGVASPLLRQFMKLHTDIAAESPKTLDSRLLLRVRQELADLSDLLSQTYLG